MDLTPANALDRTGLLLAADLHNGRISSREVIDGLRSTNALIHATEGEVRSPAAQHVVVTLALQLAMCGINIELDIPDVALVAPQPPLTESTLRSAIVAHIGLTYPWINLAPAGAPHVRYAIGATPTRSLDDIIVSGTTASIAIGPAGSVNAKTWRGDWPISPIAAGIAGAAEAIHTASVRTAIAAGIQPPTRPPGPARIHLNTTRIDRPQIGEMPIVSGGAITHGTLFTLLRVPDLAGDLEVFDDDRFEDTNLNRYTLLTADQLGDLKAPSLSRWATSDLKITGNPHRYEGGERCGANRMLVGADDIAVRWRAQDDCTGWLGIGATSHLFAMVSGHTPTSPCAGCIHNHEDERPDVIPTISIISAWAGLHLANDLLRTLDDPRPSLLWSYPLALTGQHGHLHPNHRPNVTCRRNCALSRRPAA